MGSAASHLSDDELAEFDVAGSDRPQIREHLQTCCACRARRDALMRLSELLAQAGNYESRPIRDVVPSAMMRLRLRRNSVTNANELLEGVTRFSPRVGELILASGIESALDRA